MLDRLDGFLMRKFNFKMKKKELFLQAFTHSSYANDYPEKHLKNLERLEFLGDAVLELCVSDYLFRHFNELSEGKLTQLRSGAVQTASLASLTKEIQLDQFILLGKGEEQSDGRKRPALLEDVFEAFLGAIYLDQGKDAADYILNQTLFPKIDRGDFSHGMDYKTSLQEYLQQDGPVKINYQVVDSRGPDHHREFDVELTVNGVVQGRGTGSSKKRAEQHAAKVALNVLKSNELPRDEE
ncbi:ribonuclease III [Allofustis seminis]|uniref:ribonuclease III n=1 Tax=Allofustis seminis TaxID=166939 RepID=UPI00035DA61A|nr:ribonuclease III [Allofustis seminis]